jgi:hypothetical protein
MGTAKTGCIALPEYLVAPMWGLKKLFCSGCPCYNKIQKNYDRLLVLVMTVLSPCEVDERYGHNN